MLQLNDELNSFSKKSIFAKTKKTKTMEGIKPTPYKTALTYGVFLGIVLILFQVLLYVFDQSTNKTLGYVSYLFIIAGIFLGTKAYRDNVRGGFISYGQGLGIGMLIILFASILSALYTYIFTEFIDPGFVTKIINDTEAQMLEQPGMGEDQVEQSMKFVRMFITPVMMTIMVIIVYVFVGFIISLITSGILQKQNPSFESVIDNT